MLVEKANSLIFVTYYQAFFRLMLSCYSVKFTQSTVFYYGTTLDSNLSKSKSHGVVEIERSNDTRLLTWNRRRNCRQTSIASLFLVLPESLINKYQESPKSGSSQLFHKNKKKNLIFYLNSTSYKKSLMT